MNKKGQAESIIIFFIMIIALFTVSIITLRITHAVLTPLQSTIGNVSAPVGQAVGYVNNRFSAFWDYIIIFIFLLNIILLFVSSFLIDIHPAFIIIYIFAVIFLFIFGNQALYVLDSMWSVFGTSTETAQTPIQQFVLNNFQIIMLGIIILNGIIMYAKFKFFAGAGAGGNY
jgi:hypothetical protein